MAPFNKRQVGYIKAIAGVGQHKSFIHYTNRFTFPTDGSADAVYDPTREDPRKFWRSPPQSLAPLSDANNYENSKAMAAAVFTLDNCPVTIDHNDTSDDINSIILQRNKFEKALGDVHPMGLLTQAPVTEGNETKAASTSWRVGEDFYLESTHIRWRFTMPDFTVSSGKQPHYEYRWLVFRQRHPTLAPGEDASGPGQYSWLNWNYDLFNGYQGRPVGLSGYRKREQFDGTETYTSGTEPSHLGLADVQFSVGTKLTADDLMTLPINEADYVVMRDERFFLGAEHGKSHYETVTRFDWSDPGSTPDPEMINGMQDQNKNYRWFFIILGTSNDNVTPNLNIMVDGTTAVTSA